MSSNNEKKTVGLPMALFTFVVVAVIMSVGLAILKINTMVTFILALFAVCVIAVCTGMSLEKLQDIILTGFKKFALIGMILISVGMVVGSWMISGIVPSIPIASRTAVSSVPRNMDTIAGGASLAPRRWSLPALATDTRSRS